MNGKEGNTEREREKDRDRDGGERRTERVCVGGRGGGEYNLSVRRRVY